MNGKKHKQDEHIYCNLLRQHQSASTMMYIYQYVMCNTITPRHGGGT